MNTVFNVQYAIHPVAPVVFLLAMANGLLAPAIYATFAKLPYDIKAVHRQAQAGLLTARYAYYSWLLFALLAVVVLIFYLASFFL